MTFEELARRFGAAIQTNDNSLKCFSLFIRNFECIVYSDKTLMARYNGDIRHPMSWVEENKSFDSILVTIKQLGVR